MDLRGQNTRVQHPEGYLSLALPEHGTYIARRLLYFINGLDDVSKHTVEQLDYANYTNIQSNIYSIIGQFMQGIKQAGCVNYLLKR